MILSHEKEAVKAALHSYLMKIASGENRGNEKFYESQARNLYHRLIAEHLPVGGFCHGDYKSHAQDCGYDLTDEQVNDLMEYSRRTFDANIGISWDVISIHLDLWAEENNIQKA